MKHTFWQYLWNNVEYQVAKQIDEEVGKYVARQLFEEMELWVWQQVGAQILIQAIEQIREE